MLLGVISLVETALQKLLELTIIFGNSIWKALDSFSNLLERNVGVLGELFSTQVLLSMYVW